MAARLRVGGRRAARGVVVVAVAAATATGALSASVVPARAAALPPATVLTGVTQVSAGSYHSCARARDGAVRCWGDAQWGLLGNGSTSADSYVPTPVSGLASGMASISAGGESSCALTDAGGVECWGLNSSGELGDGTTVGGTTPVQVSGMADGVAGVSVGYGFACAVTTAGAVRCWGWNVHGQLGDGTTTDRSVPTDVVGLGVRMVAVSAGRYHACALRDDGAVACWGEGPAGELGNGSRTAYTTVPVWVVGLPGPVASLSAGDRHTCAVTRTGRALCWGANGLGELGNGTTEASAVPVDVSGLGSGVDAVAAGVGHSCALVGGSVLCWGYNQSGQLGDGTTRQRLAPVAVLGLPSGVLGVTTGYFHTCAVLDTGEARCWGTGESGQLGTGTTAPTSRPAAVLTRIPLVIQVTDTGLDPSLVVAGLTPNEPLTVSWVFPATNVSVHRVKDTSGLGLFDSGRARPTTLYSARVFAAGTYPMMDPTSGSRARIKVPVLLSAWCAAKPKVSVVWASQAAPPGLVYDVRLRVPGATGFIRWVTGASTVGATYTPRAGNGTYVFEARLRDDLTGAASAWSPWQGVRVQC